MNEKIELWKKVHITVLNQMPYGLSVKTDYGVLGIVRIRELSWDSKKREKFLEIYPIGTTVDAIIVKINQYKGIEFSIRLAEYDPWNKISEKYKKNQIVRGIVKGIKDYGVFIEIENGITGLLHKSNISSQFTERNLEKLFWPGDHVQASILKIDANKRKIALYIDHNIDDLVVDSNHKIVNPNRDYLDSNRSESGWRQKQRIFFIIENDEIQASFISSWLIKTNQKVIILKDIICSMPEFERITPNIVLIVNPQINEYFFDSVLKIKNISSNLSIFLVIDWWKFQKSREKIEKNRTCFSRIFFTPLLPEDLVDSSFDNDNVCNLVLENENQSSFFDGTKDIIHELILLLEESIQNSQCDYAVLLEFDESGVNPSIIAQTGTTQLLRSEINDLVYSSLRDTAVTGIPIIEGDVLEKKNNLKFQYIQAIFNFRALLSLAVPKTSTHTYCLCIFNLDQKNFSSNEILFAKASAKQIGLVLQKREFFEKGFLLQKNALVGKITNSILHEINHPISVLIPKYNEVKQLIDHLIQNSSTNVNDKNTVVARIGERLIEIRKTLSLINTIVRAFTISRYTEKKEYCRIDDLLDLANSMVNDFAKENKVQIKLNVPSEIFVLQTYIAQLLQVIWNLLINAIEQISDSTSNFGGTVEIQAVKKILDNNKIKIQFIITDNGPGIHVQNWEKIFEFGYTTRKEGSGLGLYITKNIVQYLGGKIIVEDSFILSGTTFIIELPYDF